MKNLVENDDGSEGRIVNSQIGDPKAATGMFQTNDFDRDLGSPHNIH